MEVHGGPENRIRRKKPDADWIRFMSDAEKEKFRIEQWQHVSIADAGLPVRIANMLETYNIMTVGDLAKKTKADLRNIQNFGSLTVTRCSNLLDRLGLPNRLKPGIKGQPHGT